MLLEVHNANFGPYLHSYSAGRSHQKSALPRIYDSEYSRRVTAGFVTAVLQTDTVLGGNKRSLSKRKTVHSPMAPWLGLESAARGWSITDTGCMQRIIDTLHDPSSQHPVMQLFVGAAIKMQAL
jgi:hypothetical protein